MSHNISLFPELRRGLAEATESRDRGVYPSQRIQEFIASGRIACRVPPEPKQIQPASLDLRLGPTAYRGRGL